jgi:hypothetical protein
MTIRASFLALTAGAVLTISGLGLNAQSISAAPANTGAKITLSHASAVTADDGTDGNDPWPKP